MSPGKRSPRDEPRRRRPAGLEGLSPPKASCRWLGDRGECGLRGAIEPVGDRLTGAVGEVAEGGGDGYD